MTPNPIGLTIDGQSVSVAPGTTIYDAANQTPNRCGGFEVGNKLALIGAERPIDIGRLTKNEGRQCEQATDIFKKMEAVFH